MTTLEDKLLGEKREYYCSSSESEQEQDSDDESEPKVVEVDRAPPPLVRDPDGSANTGPKGVIKDWQRYKQLESEQRKEREKEKLALIQKLSMTCRPSGDEVQDPDLEELIEDSFLLEYSRRRMQEMFQKAAELPRFHGVTYLNSGEEFLDAIDKENKNVTVIVHIYEEKPPGCKLMNESLKALSKDYPNIKFCKILASVAGLSKHFKVSGVPALLVYKAGNLVGNYVNMTEELGREFEPSDVEGFLIENGIINDNSCIPSLLKDSVSPVSNYNK